MSEPRVTVAVPVLDGGPLLGDVLAAVRGQRVDRPLEVLVIDSGSTDGSTAVARAHGARLVEIPHRSFSHGGTRNRLMELARGEHVAFLTQDAIPADDRWLARLLNGFELTDAVGLVCGPYEPRSDASPMVRRELAEWFGRFSPDGRPRVDRLPSGPFTPGPATFFSSANGCVARWAWKRVPFRPVPYAEDQRLAVDMLRAGFAKVYIPGAAVVHSHEYPPLSRFRRVFDEFRALREVYDHREPLGPLRVAGRIRRSVAADRAFLRREGLEGTPLDAATWRSLQYHALRALGAGLGSHADRLPPALRRWSSLEGRATFEPSHSS